MLNTRIINKIIVVNKPLVIQISELIKFVQPSNIKPKENKIIHIPGEI